MSDWTRGDCRIDVKGEIRKRRKMGIPELDINFRMSVLVLGNGLKMKNSETSVSPSRKIYSRDIFLDLVDSEINGSGLQ